MTEAEPTFLGSVGTDATGPHQPPRPEPPTARAVPPARARTAAPPTVYVAGFWHRLGAAMIDLAVVLAVATLLIWPTTALASIHLPPSNLHEPDFWLELALASDPALVTGVVITLAVASLYLFVFQATLSQTLGMRLLRLRIIDVYGDSPSYLRCGLRTAGYLLGLVTVFLGFLWIGFDAEKRGLHDWIAGPYVIRPSS